MKHIVFFIHILSFLLGCITIVLSLISYFKYKKSLIKYYSFFLISLSTILIERMITYYQMASSLSGEYLNVIFWVISCLGSGLMMYSLPLLIYEMFQLKLSEGKKMLFSLLGYLPIISLVLYYMLPYKITILNIIDLTIFILVLYCACLIIVNLNAVRVPETRKIIKTFLVIFVVWLPFTIIDLRLQEVSTFHRIFPYGLLSIPIFYFIWNFLSLYFGYRYFGVFSYSPDKDQKQSLGESTKEDERLKNEQKEDEPNISFFEKYKITNREREVIQLLIKGCSYKRISEELVISFTTARTHVYNIYQKTGAKNKIELTNLIKDSNNDTLEK